MGIQFPDYSQLELQPRCWGRVDKPPGLFEIIFFSDNMQHWKFTFKIMEKVNVLRTYTETITNPNYCTDLKN